MSPPVRLPPLEPGALLSVVVPVYNEARWVAECLRRVENADRLGCELEIVVVDDGSTDGTGAVLDELARDKPHVRIFRLDRNRGKGAALRLGFQHAKGAILLVQDADLEYDPAEYPALLRPVLENRADVVFGTRFQGGAHRVLYYWHAVGNWVLTTASNTLTNLNLTDMENCYKVFRREVIEQVTLKEDRFGFEPEITAKVAKLGARVYEVSVSYAGRTYEEGKKIGWKDGVKALWCIVRYSVTD
jgi:glycosyltransferase involved in cell wall biosynthesis